MNANNSLLWISLGIGALFLLTRTAKASGKIVLPGAESPECEDLTFSKWPVYSPDIDQWRSLAEQYGASYGVPPQLVLALIWKESGGDMWVIGDCGPAPSLGLMQISEAAAHDMQFTGTNYQPCAQSCSEPDPSLRANYRARCHNQQIFDPATNIMIGTGYLALCKSWANRSWREALWAYNWGIGNCRRVDFDPNKIPLIVRSYANQIIYYANCGRELIA